MTTPQQSKSNTNLPDFNQSGKDQMGLGHTASRRSAEMVAGVRASLLPTNETKALCSFAGGIVASVLTSLDRADPSILRIIPARMIALENLTRQVLPQDREDLFVVDVAAGFSPRALNIANNYHKAQVVEIDLPEIITEKKRRLKLRRIDVPSNFSWIEADLGATNLKDVLDDRKADLITSEGLVLYLSEAEQNRFFTQVEAALKPEGVFMSEVYFQDKIRRLRQSRDIGTIASFIIGKVGNIPGMMPDNEACQQRLSRCGLTRFEAYSVFDMMEQLNQPKPIDIASIVVTRKTAENSHTAPHSASQ